MAELYKTSVVVIDEPRGWKNAGEELQNKINLTLEEISTADGEIIDIKLSNFQSIWTALIIYKIIRKK